MFGKGFQGLAQQTQGTAQDAGKKHVLFLLLLTHMKSLVVRMCTPETSEDAFLLGFASLDCKRYKWKCPPMKKDSQHMEN